jgi:hypothetical protein
LNPEQITQVSGLVAHFITSQRRRFLPQVGPLTAAQRAAMNGFFIPQLLDTTSFLVIAGTSIENPPFYRMLKGMGFSNLPDYSRMTAMTFSDVVVSIKPVVDGRLFHELVHVEQYRQLGIPRFAEQYFRGFLTGGSYDAIPLEVNAYHLEWRFRQHPTIPFSVEDDVRRWMAEAKL